jgi:hypothetical protein
MIKSFSLSTNIIRDKNIEIEYIPTPNSKSIFNNMINHINHGIHSYSIIGSYGTGKSSFLLAFEKHLEMKESYFADLNGTFKNIDEFEFLNLVGEYDSLQGKFARIFLENNSNSYSTRDILLSIDKYIINNSGKQNALFIIIDEFGKYLEYAAKNNPEAELYFIQELAEQINKKDSNIFFITTLHQNFNAYANSLSISQKNEWDKVKGRLKELAFNEPVEQLLFLASEKMKDNQFPCDQAKLGELYDSIDKANIFPLRDYFNKNIASKLYPLDILSASILTLALQKYGQNDRSLFTFLELENFNEYVNEGMLINICDIYDYLITNFYSILTSKYNPHFSLWTSINIALERVESLEVQTVQELTDLRSIVKTIGLLNIFAPQYSKLDRLFLQIYGKLSLRVEDTEAALNLLEKFKIIRYQDFNTRFKLFDGSDLDIELAINETMTFVDSKVNLIDKIQSYFHSEVILAKEIFYKKGTPRFFSFLISEEPIVKIPKGVIDGYINLIFSTTISKEDIKNFQSKNDEPILYGIFNNTRNIINSINNIEAIKIVRSNNLNDHIAIRELDLIMNNEILRLNKEMKEEFYSDRNSITWIYNGKEISISTRKEFNKILSFISEHTYPETPCFHSELINRSKLSSQMQTARKSLFRYLSKWRQMDLGFPNEKFPPEKTIYLALLKNTGIHRSVGNNYILSEPNDSIKAIWNRSIDFLNNCKKFKRSVLDLIEIFEEKPFKLKKGLIDFWVPIFLYIKRDDFALFNKDGFIPELNSAILDIIIKKPKEYKIKAFELEGIRLEVFTQYRTMLDLEKQEIPTNQLFIETIKPFLTFYRTLPEYSKNTKMLTNNSIKLRSAIKNSIDPENSFFEDFPAALGYNFDSLKKDDIENYFKDLRISIKEIRSSFDSLINRIELFIIKEIIGEDHNFENIKKYFVQRFMNIKKHRLQTYQKVFYNRIISPIDDKAGWIISLSEACIVKNLATIDDIEEELLFDKLLELTSELDNLCELSQYDIDNGKEEIIRIETSSFETGSNKYILRLSRNKTAELTKLEINIKGQLANDKKTNIAILYKLLIEELKDEK